MEEKKKRFNLKIIIFIAIVIIAIVGIVIFTSNKSIPKEKKEDINQLQIGETYTIKGGEFEITLDDIQYASEKKGNTLCASLSQDYLKAGDFADTYYYGGKYHDNIYNPKKGEASVSVFFTIKYLGKEQIGFSFNWELDYNNGIIIKENRNEQVYNEHFNDKYYWDGTTWKKFNYLTQFEPLGLNLIETRQYVSVPAEVMENEKAPLKLNLISGDNKTICSYIIRAGQENKN